EEFARVAVCGAGLLVRAPPPGDAGTRRRFCTGALTQAAENGYNHPAYETLPFAGPAKEHCGLYILGINAYHGDAAAAIVKDGQLIAAAEEERFNRRKHCAGFPTLAIRYCLEAAGISIHDVEHIGIS